MASSFERSPSGHNANAAGFQPSPRGHKWKVKAFPTSPARLEVKADPFQSSPHGLKPKPPTFPFQHHAIAKVEASRETESVALGRPPPSERDRASDARKASTFGARPNQ